MEEYAKKTDKTRKKIKSLVASPKIPISRQKLRRNYKPDDFDYKITLNKMIKSQNNNLNSFIIDSESKVLEKGN